MWCIPINGHDETNISIVTVPLEREQVVDFVSIPIAASDQSSLVCNAYEEFAEDLYDCEEFSDPDLFFFDAVELSDAPFLRDAPLVFAPVHSPGDQV